jgi:hypothetical protein
MSNDFAKFKNSKRRHKTDVAIARQVKIVKQHHLPGSLPSPDSKQPHRLAKRHAMDCGNPSCYLCGNPRKTRKHKDRLTNQEKKKFQDTETIRDRHSNGIENGDETSE